MEGEAERENERVAVDRVALLQPWGLSGIELIKTFAHSSSVIKNAR